MTQTVRDELREEFDKDFKGAICDGFGDVSTDTTNELFDWFIAKMEEHEVRVGLHNFQIHMEEVNKLREQIKDLKSTKLNKEGLTLEELVKQQILNCDLSNTAPTVKRIIDLVSSK